jgi:hypothetical protein
VTKTDDAVWLAFEALAKTYPQDNGVRMTADLTRWLLQEQQLQGLPIPPIMHKVVDTVPANQQGGKDPDIQDMLALQFEAWGRLAELIGISTKERDAGSLKVTKQTFRHVRRLLDEINALEQLLSPKQRRQAVNKVPVCCKSGRSNRAN